MFAVGDLVYDKEIQRYGQVRDVSDSAPSGLNMIVSFGPDLFRGYYLTGSRYGDALTKVLVKDCSEVTAAITAHAGKIMRETLSTELRLS